MLRVLWLSNETGDPAGQGGQRRQFFQIRELSRAGHEVTVCSLAGAQDDSALRRHARVVRTQTHWRGRVPLPMHRRLIAQLSDREFGAVVLAHTESWPVFGQVVKNLGTRSWVDLHNVLGKDVRGAVTGWAHVEREICSQASAVSVCSEVEAARLIAQQPALGGKLTVMHHGIEPTEWQAARSPAERPLVKLFGNWGWGPNRRGLDWFLSEVWPQVGAIGARCEIAGTGAVVPEGHGGSVRFVGRVPSLNVWTRDAWIVAVPVVSGVGAPVKYLEALATGAPVISTPEGAPTAQGAAALVSSNADEWVAVMSNLLSADRAPEGGAWDMKEFSWQHVTAPLLSWLEDG